MSVHPGRRQARPDGTVAALLVGLAVLSVAVAACHYQESICSEGEYPVVNKGSFDGGTCVKDGQEPPDTYVRYPANKVPTYVTDDYTPTWADYLRYGDEQQRKQARAHLR